MSRRRLKKHGTSSDRSGILTRKKIIKESNRLWRNNGKSLLRFYWQSRRPNWNNCFTSSGKRRQVTVIWTSVCQTGTSAWLSCLVLLLLRWVAVKLQCREWVCPTVISAFLINTRESQNGGIVWLSGTSPCLTGTGDSQTEISVYQIHLLGQNVSKTWTDVELSHRQKMAF